MQRSKFLGSLFLCLVLLPIGLMPGATVAHAQPAERCFAETGYCISGPIRAFWEGNGGLAVFGLPIGPQQEAIGEDGKPRQVQWFERHRLELHPENPAPYTVQLGRLGIERLSQQGRDWRAFPPLDPNNADAERCVFFAATNHQVCDEFLRAFRSFGLNFPNTPGIRFEESLALFGLPISEPLTEVIEGKEYTVQWFERARFELHPENRPPFNVLFGRLGAEIFANRGAGGPLRGTTWQLESFGPIEAPLAARTERPATLTFEAERVNGFSGCNAFSGPYQATAAAITFGPLISTLVACTDEALGRQESEILSALTGTVPYTLAGNRLQIRYNEGRSMLTYRAAQNPIDQLRREPWQLETFGPLEAPEVARTERPATLTFEADQVNGFSGCNNFGGSYQATADTLTFGPLRTTLAACTDEVLTRQEQAIFTALTGAAPYRIEGDRLRISYDGGRKQLTYRAASVPASAVTGTVTYLQRSALPPEALIQVQLVDVSRADAPAIVLATSSFQAGGRQAPFPFALPYDPARIEERNTYAVQARITVNGQLRFISTQRYEVITRGRPTRVEVIVQPV